MERLKDNANEKVTLPLKNITIPINVVTVYYFILKINIYKIK